MKMTRIAALLLLATLACAGAACGAKKGKEITALQRKEAAHLASEAQFALTLRDWARAEAALAKAVQVCPDTGEYWVDLGSTRVRMGNRAGAKDAYKGALDAYAAEAAKENADVEAWLKQVYVLALLGRVEESRALLDKTAKRFPQDREVRAFVESKQLDRMLADPAFKQIAL